MVENTRSVGRQAGYVLGFLLNNPWRARSENSRRIIRLVSYVPVIGGPAFLLYLSDITVHHPVVMQSPEFYWASVVAAVLLMWLGVFLYQSGSEAGAVPISRLHVFAVIGLFTALVFRCFS